MVKRGCKLCSLISSTECNHGNIQLLCNDCTLRSNMENTPYGQCLAGLADVEESKVIGKLYHSSKLALDCSKFFVFQKLTHA